MKILRWMLVLFVLTGVAQSAEAGRSCEEKPVTPGVTQQALTLALDTQTKLEEAGAQVALMARAGQDLSRYGLHYSHFGFVWRDQGEDTWHVVHQLNLCGTDKSEIFDEGIGNFFLDDLWRMEA
ncbi:MAG: DUF2145 domain-containing protein, partial [Betaproteobacteria bacterium]|nr:DUF2145 domain-containing protein [Betaproteobacteria bacterium]